MTAEDGERRNEANAVKEAGMMKGAGEAPLTFAPLLTLYIWGTQTARRHPGEGGNEKTW